MTRHTYSPGMDGFCGVCQEPDGYCQGTRAASSPRQARPASAAPALAVVPNGSQAAAAGPLALARPDTSGSADPARRA